jgi:hypothetical protein
MVSASVSVGVLVDQRLTEAEQSHQAGLQAGLRDSHLDRDVDLIVVHVDGLPEGTAHAVTQGFTELVSAGAVAIVGPAVTDNALIARDLADAARVPCLNWSGNERTRGRYCFQYQVGSLEEEAAVVHRALQQAQVRRVGWLAAL